MDKLSEMRPGRELDALVASKVMGIEIDGDVWPDDAVVCPVLGDQWYMYIQPYSTDIAAAWTILEKLKDDFNFTLSLQGETYFLKLIGIDSVVTAEANTAPHVICLAALKAVGYDI